MKNVRRSAALAAVFALSACATSGNGGLLHAPQTQGQSIGYLLNQPMNTLYDVERTGFALQNHYLSAGQRRSSNRQGLNWALWVASTATTALTGLKVGGDAPFLSALSVTSIRALDPVLNPGDDNTWSTAFVATTCVTTRIHTANTDAINTAALRLQGANSTADSAAALSAYANLNEQAHLAFLTIYGRYLSSSTPKLLDASTFTVAGQGNNNGHDGATAATAHDLATPGNHIETPLTAWFEGPAYLVHGPYFEVSKGAPVPEDISLVKTASTAASSGIAQCVPEAPGAPPQADPHTPQQAPGQPNQQPNPNPAGGHGH